MLTFPRTYRHGSFGAVSAAALIICLPTLASAQKPAPAAAIVPTERKAARSAMDRALETERARLDIPGIALVIVQDDQIVEARGFGMRDAAKRLPVTPDTLFAIGSSTKAFTALSIMIAVDNGKVSLDASPKKYLPYFKINDPEIDAKITLRDLMCHRSGLDRTDLAMVTGKLSREELIRVAGVAKPTAKLGERFQYQNLMFTAAGEAAARAEKTSYEKLVTDRILRPLGMSHTTFSVAEMQQAKDYSLGVCLKPASHRAVPVPQRDIAATAPAGAINASARDMAQWLRFMLRGDGTFQGKRIVSQKSFNELTKTQMRIAGTMGYGLGWFIEDWNGHKVIEHGGNIDGFNAEVAFMPDRHIGFVMLSNVSASPLGQGVLDLVWSHLVGKPQATGVIAAADSPKAAPKEEAGTYSAMEPAISMNVTADAENKLTLTVAGQPPYPMENIGGRRYKLASPAPSGFFVTFRPGKTDATKTEMFLEQPQGNLTLVKEAPTAAVELDAALRPLTGSYEHNGHAIELINKGGKLALAVPGQPAYILAPSGTDMFTAPQLPGGFGIAVRRAADNKIVGITLKQPNGSFDFDRAAETGAGALPLPTADELTAKVVAAYGGEANLRKHRTRVITEDADFENQGVTAKATITDKAPNAEASHMVIMALGKPIGTIDEFCDGTHAGQVGSFIPLDIKEGKELSQKRLESDFNDGLLNAATLFSKVEVKRKTKVGGEEAFVVVKTLRDGGNPITDYLSTTTYLLLRRDSLEGGDGESPAHPVSETFADYRDVDGIKVAYSRTMSAPGMGRIATKITSVRLNVPVSDAVFQGPKK